MEAESLLSDELVETLLSCEKFEVCMGDLKFAWKSAKKWEMFGYGAVCH